MVTIENNVYKQKSTVRFSRDIKCMLWFDGGKVGSMRFMKSEDKNVVRYCRALLSSTKSNQIKPYLYSTFHTIKKTSMK